MKNAAQTVKTLFHFARMAGGRMYYSPDDDLILEGKLLPFKEGVGLFNFGRKWWLRYGYEHQTGPFKSKKAAVHWYEHGGR